jgi:hypothetical protein
MVQDMMIKDTQDSLIKPASERTPWQYSLRGLLIVTAIVSVVLAISIYFAGVLFVLGVIALIQAATLLAADWLIRPENRRVLAAVSSGTWMILGSGVMIIACRQAFLMMRDDGNWTVALFTTSLAATAGLCCCTVAANRWRRLAGPQVRD